VLDQVREVHGTSLPPTAGFPPRETYA
jgi:hypothetical protein